jgi:transcriptional regulator with XRE-family HTH domain
VPVKKTQARWGDAHIKLRRLFDERAGLSQQDFAKRYGFGTQGMVWQYLSGHRPLNYEAAAKFAKGLGCKIDDFSPEMAAALREEILPVLGKSLRRAAVVLLAFLLQQLASFDAKASGFSHNVDSGQLLLYITR